MTAVPASSAKHSALHAHTDSPGVLSGWVAGLMSALRKAEQPRAERRRDDARTQTIVRLSRASGGDQGLWPTSL